MLPIRETMPDPESENYFVEAEQEFVEDWLEEEITARLFFSRKLINLVHHYTCCHSNSLSKKCEASSLL